MKKSRTIEPIKKDSLDREIKLLVTFTLIAFVIVGTLPYLQFHFIDPLIQYVDAASYYIKADDVIRLTQAGTGTTCPQITGPASVVSSAGTSMPFQYNDDASATGCFFNVYVIEDSIFPEEIANEVALIVGGGPAGGYRYVLDLDEADTDYPSGCIVRLPDNGSDTYIDPRINGTAAYDAVRNAGNHLTDIGGGFLVCATANAQGTETDPGDEFDYLARTNQTIWSYSVVGSSFARFTGASADREVTLDDLFQSWSIAVPVNHTNNWWQIQEHAMYGGTFPAITDGFVGIDDTTFTMDTGSTVTQRGQVTMFKQFNKTELWNGTHYPDIKVQGGIMSLGSADDTHIHVEIRDGDFQAGQTQGRNVKSTTNFQLVSVSGHDGNAYFERNFFPSYKYFDLRQKPLHSLGVYDLEDPTVGTADDFEISFIPNWSNSTEDIITVFVAVQDDSTTGSLIANITSIELENNIRYNFTNVQDLVFYEPDCNAGFAGHSGGGIIANGANCQVDYSNGLIKIANVTTTGSFTEPPPTPEPPTNLVASPFSPERMDLTWDHPLTNVTNFLIQRDDGAGFNTIALINDPTLLSFKDVNQPNVTLAETNQFTNATSLTPDTSYSYKVCAVNGNVTESTCDITSATTTDEENVWFIREHDGGSGAEATFATTGGSGNWLSMSSFDIASRGHQPNYLWKSFNVTETDIRDSDIEFYWDHDRETGSAPDNPHLKVCQNKWTSYNDTIFEFGSVGGEALCNEVTTWGIIGPSGAGTAFEPYFARMGIDWESITEDFITVYLSYEDDSATTSYDFDIKNFTWTNATSWDFTGLSLNFTASDDFKHAGQVAECQNFILTDPFSSSSNDCDSGAFFADATPQTEFKETEGENDWQFRELKAGGSSDSFGFFSVSPSGFTMTSTIGVTNDEPTEETKLHLFKGFPATEVIGEDISIGWGKTASGGSQFVQVFNGTLDRWNGTHFENDNLIANNNELIDTLTLPVPSVDSYNTDTVAVVPSTTNVTVIVWLDDNSPSTQPILTVKNVTIGSFTYIFTGSSILNEEVSDTNGGDRGLVTPDSIIQPPPANITNLAGIAVNATVSLTWDDADRADIYYVLRNSTTVGNSTLSDFIDSTPATNTFYNYTVFASNTGGDGNASSTFVLTNDFPSAPQNLTAAMGLVIPDLEDVFLEWEHPLDNGTGSPSTGVNIIHYQIERKAGIGPFAFLANTTDATPEFEDETVVSSANYTWRVRGVNGVGFSSYSNTFSLITTPLMPPNAPTNLTATTVSGSQINVEWLAAIAGDPPTDYVLQQRHVGFTGFVTIATIPAPTLFYNVTGLLPGNTYDYRVRADNGAGSSAYSNIDQAITFNVPSAPQTLTATTINNTAIFLDWVEPSSVGGGITKYNIERESPIGGGFTEIVEITGDTFGLNGTWQYREHGFSTATFSHLAPSSDSNSINLYSTLTGRVTSASLFKTFPTSFLNNTNVTATWRGWVQDFGGGTGRLYVVNAAMDRNNFSQFPADDNGCTAPAAGTYTFQSPISSFALGTGFDVPRFTSTMTNTVTYNTPDGTDSTIFMLMCRNSVSIEVGLEIFTLNITDATTGDLKANYTFSNSIQTIEDSTDEDKRGLFEEVNFIDQIINTTTITEYTDLGLTQNTVYNYRINAENEIGTGVYSNQDNDRTHGVPDAPINLSYTTDGVSSITVDWDSPVYTGGVALTAYTIDQAQGIGGTFITATPNHPVTPTDKTYTSLLLATNYIYKIAAKNQYGTGAYSANLTAGTFAGPSEPENFNAVFNSTRPYSVNLSWSVPLDDGGEPIKGYLIQRKDLGGVYQQIANVTNSTFTYIDTNLINLATHTYRIAAYGSVGDFTADQPVTTVVPANFVNYTITDFNVVGDVLRQDYTFVIDDCFPQCTFTIADVERNGIVESTFPYGTSITLDATVTFTTWFVLPNNLPNSINTTAFVTNLGSSEDDEAGVTLATADFLVPGTIFYNHTRTPSFEDIIFTLVRHPVPWSATCEQNNGGGFAVDQGPVYGQAGVQPILSLQNVGYFNDTLNAVPSLNTYVACFNPPNQILAFTSFGLGNGTFALTSFTGQLGDFLGVPVPFIFIIFLAAIWTGRSASTGIIFLSVAIGAMGVLGYFPGFDDQPLIGGAFWSLIVLLTALGVLVGKRFF